MRKLAAVLLLVLVASVSLAQNVPVTERRTVGPFTINWVAAHKLASHIFAEAWTQGRVPEWHIFYPSRARITTTYGNPITGDSLTPVDDRPLPHKRPCWVFWKEPGLTGVAIERGEGGNTIVSTFTIITEPTPVTERIVTRDVVRTITEYVETPGEVKTVFVNTGFYHPPAGLTQETGTNISVPSGRAFYGPEENQVVLGFRRVPDQPKPAVCPPEPPPPPPPPGGPTCPPGTPNPPNPPNSPEVNVPPNDPSTPTVPGGDSVLPGVGPPEPNVPDHGSHDGAGDVNYSPADPNIADRVDQSTL